MHLKGSFLSTSLYFVVLLASISATQTALPADTSAKILAQTSRKVASAADSNTTDILKNIAFREALQAYEKAQYEKVENIFKKLLRQYPNHPLILNNLAVALAKQGKQDLAIQLLKDALASDKILSVSYQNLSAIYAYQAVDAYRNALSLSIDSPEPLQLKLIGQTTETAEPVSVVKKILADKDNDQPLVQEPATPTVLAKNIENEDVIRSVERWAKAWSSKDIKKYLASYHPAYAPANKTHNEWKLIRIRRIRTPQTINITVSNIRIQPQKPNKITVTFRQNYRSSLLNSIVTKRLEMTRINGEWKITNEKVLR